MKRTRDDWTDSRSGAGNTQDEPGASRWACKQAGTKTNRKQTKSTTNNKTHSDGGVSQSDPGAP